MRRKHHEEDEADVDMTPMLDIVFIMLIFFIVATSFVKESGVNINRPSAQPQKEQEIKKAPIVIKIDATNLISIDDREIDVRAVQANVERKKAENPEAIVIVQANKDSETETLVAVVDAARDAGIAKISVASPAE